MITKSKLNHQMKNKIETHEAEIRLKDGMLKELRIKLDDEEFKDN